MRIGTRQKVIIGTAMVGGAAVIGGALYYAIQHQQPKIEIIVDDTVGEGDPAAGYDRYAGLPEELAAGLRENHYRGRPFVPRPFYAPRTL